MTYEQLIAHFGSQAEAARVIGIKPPSVCEWQKNGIPELRQIQIERLTKGKLRADKASDREAA